MIFKAALFDLDGTLLDSIPVILKSAREVFVEMDLRYDEDAIRKTIGIPLKVQARDWAGERWHEFESKYRAAYKRNQYGDFHLFPGTVDMLKSLRSAGVKTALVTSKSTNGARSALENTGMNGLFDAIISADDVKHAKPQPEPILKALSILDVNPDEALYVGDSAFDIDAAQRAGVQPIAVSWGARSKDDLLLMCPDKVFDTWPEFVTWIRNGENGVSTQV